MKKEFKGNSRKGGIYKITDQTSGKFYIGSAKEFKRRASQHETGLDQDKHHNKHLLNLWKKYGSSNFLFEVVEVIEGSTQKRRLVEQQYINKFWGCSEFLNHKKKVTKIQGPWSSTPEETKRKISKALTGKKLSAELKQKLSKIHKTLGTTPPLATGKKRSEETRQKMSKALKGKNKGKNPWNKGRTGTQTAWNKGLKGVSQHSDKTKQKISNRNKGKGNPFYGQQHSKKTIRQIKEKLQGNENRSKQFVLLSPEGEIVRGTNLAKFAREYNLSQQNLHAVLNGKRKSYKGWTIPNKANTYRGTTRGA